MDIRIPDGPSDPHHRVDYNDTVKFKFDETQSNFTVTGAGSFTPPLPSGGFLKGNEIGPYQASMRGATVKFTYEDKREDKLEVTTHTILIGS
jgi:hypothetical protein